MVDHREGSNFSPNESTQVLLQRRQVSEKTWPLRAGLGAFAAALVALIAIGGMSLLDPRVGASDTENPPPTTPPESAAPQTTEETTPPPEPLGKFSVECRWSRESSVRGNCAGVRAIVYPTRVSNDLLTVTGSIGDLPVRLKQNERVTGALGSMRLDLLLDREIKTNWTRWSMVGTALGNPPDGTGDRGVHRLSCRGPRIPINDNATEPGEYLLIPEGGTTEGRWSGLTKEDSSSVKPLCSLLTHGLLLSDEYFIV